VLLLEQAHEARYQLTEASLSAYVFQGESHFDTPNVPFPVSSRKSIWPFRYPKRSISCIQPQEYLAGSWIAGAIECDAQFATWIRDKLVFLRNPGNGKIWAPIKVNPLQHFDLC
jgi:hypothetical protein